MATTTILLWRRKNLDCTVKDNRFEGSWYSSNKNIRFQINGTNFVTEPEKCDCIVKDHSFVDFLYNNIKKISLHSDGTNVVTEAEKSSCTVRNKFLRVIRLQ